MPTHMVAAVLQICHVGDATRMKTTATGGDVASPCPHLDASERTQKRAWTVNIDNMGNIKLLVII